MNNIKTFFFLTLFSVGLVSQELTTTLRGNVSSGDTAVSNATVVISNDAGFTLSRTSNADGGFAFPSIAPGAYTISASASNYLSASVDTYLVIGKTEIVSIELSSAQNVDDITVVGESVSKTQISGVGRVISTVEIENLGAVGKDIKDFIRLDPRANVDDAEIEDGFLQFNFGGLHHRMNNLMVDGMSMNDDFGLNDSGYPSQSSPISIDIIEQIVINMGDPDVEYGGFGGADINIITKTGSNELEGMIDISNSDSDLAGDKYFDGDTASRDYEMKDPNLNFEQSFMSGYVSGPIIKDKLFFLVQYEESDREIPYGAGYAGSGADFEIGVTLAQLEQIQAHALNTFGYDTGIWVQNKKITNETSTVTLTAELDMHSLNLTTRSVDSERYGSGDFSGDYSTPSNITNKIETVDTTSFSVNSYWNDQLTTELKFGVKEQITDRCAINGAWCGRDGNVFLAGNAMSAEIDDVYTFYDVNIGPGRFDGANFLEQEENQIKFKATYLSGNHEIKLGYETKSNQVTNYFIEYGNGWQDYDGLNEFLTGVVDDIEFTFPVTRNPSDALATFEIDRNTFYIQDDYMMSDRLNLTFGLRYDELSTSDAPQEIPKFVEVYGFSNTATLDGIDLLQPRFSADLALDDVSSLNFSMGRYMGRNPMVWVSNSYNYGANPLFYERTDRNCSGLAVQGSLDPCVVSSFDNFDASDIMGDMDFIAPDLEAPFDDRYSLVYKTLVDMTPIGLGPNWDFTASYIRINKRKEFVTRKISGVGAPNGFYPGTPSERYPDGKVVHQDSGYYGGIYPDNYVFGLYTQGAGSKAENITLELAKYFDNDVDLYFAYNGNDATELSPLTSSRAASNTPNNVWTGNQFNYPVSKRSIYETEHKFVLSLIINRNHFANLNTSYGFSFTRKSGNPYSWTFDAGNSEPWDGYRNNSFGLEYDLNRRNSGLLYIPTENDPNVCYGSCENPDNAFKAQFLDVIAQLGLSDYAGSVVPAGTHTHNWVTTSTFQIRQELPGLYEGHSGELYFTMNNFLNFLNDEWGRVDYGMYNGIRPLVRFTTTDDLSKYIYTGFSSNSFDPDNPDGAWRTSGYQSVWRARIGFKYRF